MSLFVTLTFHDDDPDLHLHFTPYAQSLDDTDPSAMARMLHQLEHALEGCRVRVERARTALEDRLDRG